MQFAQGGKTVMANPQKENGFTPIANEILEHIVTLDLSGSELRTLLFVIRNIYGWNGRKEVSLRIEDIGAGTGLHRITVTKALAELVAKGLLQRQEKPSKGAPSVSEPYTHLVVLKTHD
jgi:phage replication O-like protein O